MKPTFRVLLIHTMMFHERIWQKAADMLKDLGVELVCVGLEQAEQKLSLTTWNIVTADTRTIQGEFQGSRVGSWKYGEMNMIARFPQNIDFHVMGRGFTGIEF